MQKTTMIFQLQIEQFSQKIMERWITSTPQEKHETTVQSSDGWTQSGSSFYKKTTSNSFNNSLKNLMMGNVKEILIGTDATWTKTNSLSKHFASLNAYDAS